MNMKIIILWIPVLNQPSLSNEWEVISGKLRYVRKTPSPLSEKYKLK